MNYSKNYEESNVIQFPAVGTYMYNATRLHGYEASLRRAGRLTEVEVLAVAIELYDQDMLDVNWDPETGEPIFVSKYKKEEEL